MRLTDTKNNEARLVPLTQAATEVFKQALNNPVRPLDCDLVFFGEPGKKGKLGPYAYTKLWNQAKKQARLDDFRFHDLRHEAVSRLVEAGLSGGRFDQWAQVHADAEEIYPPEGGGPGRKAG
ncbi:tyrosine-type recombinase/integrase [Halomonas sp. G11]|uniref:tyrosine-type recombinase/integrase n=1 Tax=Halomonas sp. G11 TaxID=1684425 RepID=UPI001F179132|nr:tyrosine-type recombinase/integrase [Halomonas sp. G11]